MLDHLPDLESDFSVFHRIDDISTLPAPRFFRLAWRIDAYDGVVRRLMLDEVREAAFASSGPAPAGSNSNHVLSLDEMATSPLFAANQTGPALFEIGHADA